MMRTFVVLIAILATMSLAASETALGEVPQKITYQGRITNAVGTPLDTTVTLTFTIYSDSLGATSLWSEKHASVKIASGVFQVLLGSIDPIGQSVMNGSERWLGISIDETPAVSLIPLVSTAYAYRANVTDTASLAKSVADNSITSAKIVNGAIQLADIGQNGAAVGEVIKWTGSAWDASADATGSNVSGWTDGGTVVGLTTAADTVAINTSLRLGKLNVGGDVGLKALSSIYFGNDTTRIKAYSGDDVAVYCGDFFVRTRGSSFFGDNETVWFKLYNSNKRVGIGTNGSPDDRLHLEDSSSLGTCWLKIQTSHPTDWGQTGLRIQTPVNTWHLRQDGFLGSNFPVAALSLYSSSGAVEATTWLENGNVGIGTIDPNDHRLHVKGSGSGQNGSTLFAETRSTSGVAAYCWANSTNPTVIVSQKGTGDILRGITLDNLDIPTIVTRVTSTGRVICPVLELTGGSDVAEPFEMTDGEELPAGALVVIDENNPGRLRLADSPYDARVAGVVSGAGGVNPGITLSQKGLNEGGQNVAISGRVYCLADAGYGAIKPGDLLTTSATRGHAMVASDRDRAYGAVIGKAMSSLGSGTGLVLILVSLQ
jgi:hypothetical protein